jgi:pimeloyl-ACP methyl ester carboxylesterase
VPPPHRSRSEFPRVQSEGPPVSLPDRSRGALPRMRPDVTAVSAGAQAPRAGFGSGLADLYTRGCADWPTGGVPPAFYTLPPAPAATLLLSGGLDPVTPPRHGERVTQALGPLARHVVVPNAGHGLLALACLRDAAFRFIDAETDVQALQVDADCARDIPRPPAFAPLAAAAEPAR